MNCIALVYGLPGVGKTTVCREIEAQTGADYCCVDELWETLFESPTYSPAESSQVFRELLRRLEVKMSRGASSLILAEGVFASAGRIQQVRDLADNTGYLLRCYLLTCDRDKSLERIRRRERESVIAQKQMQELWHFLSDRMNSGCEADLEINTNVSSPREGASTVCRDLARYLRC